MFEIDALSTTIFALLFLGGFYVIACSMHGHILKPRAITLLYYITIFSLIGVVGELFVNTTYIYFFHTPLWEYRLFPAHNGSISYFFPFVWGSLGVYKYITDHLFISKRVPGKIRAGLITGAEAIYLELLYNGLYFSSFGDYIFYYFPKNLGLFSHFSCLQVIPFYFIVGFLAHALIQREPREYRKKIPLFFFCWIVIIIFVWFV